jgi:energy-converting hydrogenase Eha subunit E
VLAWLLPVAFGALVVCPGLGEAEGPAEADPVGDALAEAEDADEGEVDEGEDVEPDRAVLTALSGRRVPDPVVPPDPGAVRCFTDGTCPEACRAVASGGAGSGRNGASTVGPPSAVLTTRVRYPAARTIRIRPRRRTRRWRRPEASTKTGPAVGALLVPSDPGFVVCTGNASVLSAGRAMLIVSSLTVVVPAVGARACGDALRRVGSGAEGGGLSW